MSKEKVDKYKEQKSRRKEIFEQEKKKEKLDRMMFLGVGALFIVVCAISMGVSTYNSYTAKIAARPNYNREERVIDDMASVLVEED